MEEALLFNVGIDSFSALNSKEVILDDFALYDGILFTCAYFANKYLLSSSLSNSSSSS